VLLKFLGCVTASIEVKHMFYEPFPENKQKKKTEKMPLKATEMSSFSQLQKEFFCMANATGIILLDRPLKNSVRSEKFNN